MPIDLSTVNWLYVSILAGFVFVATLLGSIISFRNKLAARCEYGWQSSAAQGLARHLGGASRKRI